MHQLLQSLSIIPPAWRLPFYAVAAAAVLVFVVGTGSRLAVWRLGKDVSLSPVDSPRRGWRVVGGLLRLSLVKLFAPDCILARRVFVRSRWRGVMLLGIIWGALILLAGVLVSLVTFVAPWPLLGSRGQWAFSVLLDLAGGALLIGLFMALGRRYLFRPQRWISVPADGVVLTLFTLVVLLGFLMEGARLAGTGVAAVGRWPVGAVFGLGLSILSGGQTAGLAAAYPAFYLLHALLALALLAYLPFSKLFHLFAAQIVSAERSAGQQGRQRDTETRRYGDAEGQPIPASRPLSSPPAPLPDFARHLTQLQLISLDACTRCCECLRWCPVYDITGDESLTTPEKIRVFGDLVRQQHGIKGKLGGTVQVKPEVMEKLTQALYTCTTCGVCGEVCPVGINTQRLWPAMRATMVDLGHGPVGGQRQAKAIVREKHNPYDRPHADRFAWLPPDVAVAERAEIGYYCGCSGAYTAQPMLVGALRMFQAAGIEFTLFDDEWCCSFPLFIIGELDLATELVRHNVEGFAARGVKRLVVSCPCCIFMIREHWPALYGGDLPFDVVHITQVMSKKIEAGEVRFTRPLPETITYHDPCYLARGVRILDEPREVIGAFPQVHFVEMERCRELSKCCGSGGGIRRAYTQLSIDMGRALIRDAERVGAKIMVIDCPACYERLHLAKQGFDTDLKIMDLMQLAAELL